MTSEALFVKTNDVPAVLSHQTPHRKAQQISQIEKGNNSSRSYDLAHAQECASTGSITSACSQSNQQKTRGSVAVNLL